MNKQELTHSFDANVGLLPIGAISRSLGIHPRSLRIYDQHNILSPQRSDGDRRLYSFNDVEKAKLILFLTRNLALNLSGVKIILTMLEKMDIEPKDYMNYIEQIAKFADIDTSLQEINIKKNAKRGRRPKKI